MKYKDFIEEYLLIDEPKTGKLVPFVFNQVQRKEYQFLVDQGIEKLGVGAPIREFILKARREGFSSLILALFAADDILQENPTESMVVSYKDDATATFRKRYRRYVLSYFARKSGVTVEQIQFDPNILEQFPRQVFSVDASDLELRHNRAHFYCGTAAARTGGRGGVLQKLLFSEAAHYQDTEKMTAKEVIEGTSQQVDKSSGWIFQESTANGEGNYFHQTYEMIQSGLSRYIKRFFGWEEFYTPEQFAVIASEFTDKDMLKQEYPRTEEEAFLSSNLSYTSKEELFNLIGAPAHKELSAHLEMGGVNYIDQCELIRDFATSFANTHPNRNVYLGLDTAKHVDRTILTILTDKDLSAQGGIRGIAVDSTGQGDFVPDWFERNTRWFVHRVTFSRPSKSTMYKNLQVVIQDRMTQLPEFFVDGKPISDEWGNFYRQLVSLQKQVIGNLLVVSHPKGYNKPGEYSRAPHDDYPDSWALAEMLYVFLNGVPEGQRPPDEAPNFSTSVRRLLSVSNSGSNYGRDD